MKDMKAPSFAKHHKGNQTDAVIEHNRDQGGLSEKVALKVWLHSYVTEGLLHCMSQTQIRIWEEFNKGTIYKGVGRE